MKEGQKYARIHPDARQDGTPVKRRDTCGIVFERGNGSYKGWHPVTDEQADKLSRQHLSPNNPNTMRIFQIESVANVDLIAASESRAKMSPEAKRIDVTRERELESVKEELRTVKGALSALASPQLLALLADPSLLAKLNRLTDLDAAVSGQMTKEAGDRIESVVAGPPRRGPMDERLLDDPSDKRNASTTSAATSNNASNKPAPPPPGRPGAQPGKTDAKKDGKDAPKKQQQEAQARPGAAPSAPPAPSAASPSDALSDTLDVSLLDEEDDS